jgi:hypothetical protein
VIKERGDRGQLAPDGALGQATAFEVFAPGDQVGAGDLSHLSRVFYAGKGREFCYIDPVSTPGARVIEVNKPLHFGRHLPPNPWNSARLNRSTAVR